MKPARGLDPREPCADLTAEGVTPAAHLGLAGQHPTHDVVATAGHPPGLHERSELRADLWDTNPDHVFGTPGEEPDPAPSGRDEHPKKVVLKDHTGRLRLPAYVLIMMAVVLAATVLLTLALMVAPT